MGVKIVFRNRSVNVHQFSMIPSPDVPRSAFDRQSSHKTTFDAGLLVPIFADEVLPGDSFKMRMTAFCRLATPLFPIMDNLYLDTFFFFVPNRLVWTNWVRFMGQQDNPDDSISYEIPQQVSPANGYPVNSLQDYFGLPTVGQVGSGLSVSHSALFLRAYNLIWNEWFRDENLQDSVRVDKGDGPDEQGYYTLLRRGKRKDYFTSALPWPQKGTTPVSLPLGTSAPVVGQVGVPIGVRVGTSNSTGALNQFQATGFYMNSLGGGNAVAGDVYLSPEKQNSGMYADLTEATAATINQLRQAFQIQRLLERDARGGTRYTEIVRAHFGVISPDARLQRPEYLGGGSTPISVNPVAQTSSTLQDSTPQGNLSAFATALARDHGFGASFTEHGMIIGLASVRADLSYQRGLRKMWSRRTKYDFYWPAFSHLGEQAILNAEIFCTGGPDDNNVFGYQERWAEYRYFPSMITGLFRSSASGTIDAWHASQNFVNLPVLTDIFIQDRPPVDRLVAVGSAANGQQILFDGFFDVRCVRPLPMFSVPGLIDHF